jgi:dienelactone hydrolase
MSCRFCLAPLLAVLCLITSAPGAEKVPETVFDVPAILKTPLNPKMLKKTEKDGIVTEEVMFHSEMDGKKSVDIFGYFSYPKGAKNLPAFIWNQGGLSKAGPYFTEFGAKRGYAGLCIDFPMPGYRSTGDYPIVSGLELTKDLKQAPIYHGAVALLKAVSFLEQCSEVDKNRIGMCGSSWGGFYTTLMVGVDPRLKVGSAMFGCGGLQLGNSWWATQPEGKPSPDSAYLERWRQTLDPAWRLPNRTTPIAWFTGTNDNFYWMPGLMQSYDRAGGPKLLALLPNWDHGLDAPLDEEVFTWLDVYLKGAQPLLSVTPLHVEKKGKDLVAKWTFSGKRPVKRAEVLLSFGDSGNWRARYWISVPAQIDGQTCQAVLPPCKSIAFVSGTVLDNESFRSSTPLVRIDPAALGLATSANIPDYNTCSEWGSFEPAHVEFLDRHAYSHPPIAKVGRKGTQGAELPAGATPLGPILLNSGIAHRLSCYLKADKPTDVTVSLTGLPAGHAGAVEQKMSVGTEWTEIHRDLAATGNLFASLRLVINVPKGAKVLLDDMEVHPSK